MYHTWGWEVWNPLRPIIPDLPNSCQTQTMWPNICFIEMMWPNTCFEEMMWPKETQIFLWWVNFGHYLTLVITCGTICVNWLNLLELERIVLRPIVRWFETFAFNRTETAFSESDIGCDQLLWSTIIRPVSEARLKSLEDEFIRTAIVLIVRFVLHWISVTLALNLRYFVGCGPTQTLNKSNN